MVFDGGPGLGIVRRPSQCVKHGLQADMSCKFRGGRKYTDERILDWHAHKEGSEAAVNWKQQTCLREAWHEASIHFHLPTTSD